MTTNTLTAREVILTALDNYGFFTEDVIPVLAADADFRKCEVLVRCGMFRGTCRVAELADKLAAIRAGDDYVRDVSFTCREFDVLAAIFRPRGRK